MKCLPLTLWILEQHQTTLFLNGDSVQYHAVNEVDLSCLIQ